MQLLNTILNIVVLLLSLSVLICLHELGHLLVAKKFNVYCAEYSIGMGPLIYKRKKPGQETQFSIRALPIGGFVAMAGEGSEDIEDFRDVPKERFLNNIARWKRALIMVAGVTVNFLLALVLFFFSGLCSPILDSSYRSVKVYSSNENTAYLAHEAGLTEEDEIASVRYEITIDGTQTTIESPIENGRDLYTTFNLFALETSAYYESELASPHSEMDTWTWHLTTTESKEVSFTLNAKEQIVDHLFGVDEVVYVWDLSDIGIAFHTRNRNFVEGMNRAGDEFVSSDHVVQSPFSAGRLGKSRRRAFGVFRQQLRDDGRFLLLSLRLGVYFPEPGDRQSSPVSWTRRVASGRLRVRGNHAQGHAGESASGHVGDRHGSSLRSDDFRYGSRRDPNVLMRFLWMNCAHDF